jgi:hypothetical protein
MDSESLKQYIKSKRESLSPSSIKTYTSVLRGMSKQVYGSSDISEKQLNDYKKVVSGIEEFPIPRKKTILSALVVISTGKAQEEYRKEMMDSLDLYRSEISKNEKTDKQRDNWVTKVEIEQKIKDMEKVAKAVMSKYRKNGTVSTKDIQSYQDFLLLVLTSGVYFPPRRSLDWLAFKINNADEKKDNYMHKDYLVFNKYKTSKSYGKQEIKVPRKIVNYIKNFTKIVPEGTQYLLTDSRGNPFYKENDASGSVKVNQRLSKLFGERKVGVNSMRHTNLTEKFGKYLEERKEIDKKIEREMSQMGSSSAMLDTYVKTD